MIFQLNSSIEEDNTNDENNRNNQEDYAWELKSISENNIDEDYIWESDNTNENSIDEDYIWESDNTSENSTDEDYILESDNDNDDISFVFKDKYDGLRNKSTHFNKTESYFPNKTVMLMFIWYTKYVIGNFNNNYYYYIIFLYLIKQ
jgi:hypothetical protein